MINILKLYKVKIRQLKKRIHKIDKCKKQKNTMKNKNEKKADVPTLLKDKLKKITKKFFWKIPKTQYPQEETQKSAKKNKKCKENEKRKL